ncbi:HAD family hydrolase, partial [Rhizobium ruizarguesonis]
VAAIIAVADAVKETTPAAIAALHRLGLKVAMVTGDDKRTAEAVARGLGIDEVWADVLPTDKAEVVKDMQRRGVKVA